MITIKNQSIAITGATGGIGQSIAEMAAREGARLAITGRDEQKLSALKTKLISLGAQSVVASVVDMTQEAQVADFFVAAKNQLGALQVLVNVPGLSIPGQLSAMKVEDIRCMLDVNVTGMFLAGKHFVSAAAETDALIVAIGSVASKKANPNAPGYCAAKAAMAMLAQGMALQFKERKIRVTTLNPGAVDSPFWGTRQVPREKFMQAGDVTEVVKFVLTMPRHVVIHDVTFEAFEMFKQ